MEEKIKAVLIFEMLGRPAEHLKATMEQFIDKISKEERIEIINKKFNEPKKLEQTKELFTTFAETEIDFQNIQELLKIIFVYMPSHVEIVYPEELKIKNFELNTIANELVRKLHQYDEIAKKLVIERNILQRQLQEQGVKPVTEEFEKTEIEKKGKGKKDKKSEKKIKKSREKIVIPIKSSKP